jgi:16S rRNA (guanine527-N7)-methyltransferase
MIGADARAGRDADHAWQDRKARPKEHLSLFEADARAARFAFERLLETDASALRPLLPPGFADAAERFVALLLTANARLNLTRVVQPEAVARLHLLDSVAALPLVDAARPVRALDLGTGGGVPGLVLAMARPDVRWTLVDSVRKKADAVAGLIGEMALANADTRSERAEALGRGDERETFGLVVARACAALPVLAEYALPLLRVDGTLVAWKGPLAAAEVAAGAAAASELGGGEPAIVPAGTDALGDHRFVIVRKVRPTPDRYPRRPGEPARRPLGCR